MDRGTLAVLRAAAVFYNRLLLENADRFGKVLASLAKRGVNPENINRFGIGFAPPLSDDSVAGRALLDHNLDRFNQDFHVFGTFAKAGLFRLLNDETTPGHFSFRRYIDFSRPGPFSRDYAGFFAGRITFPSLTRDGRFMPHAAS